MSHLIGLFVKSLRDFGASLVERLPYLLVAVVVVVLFLFISRLAVRGAVAAGQRAGVDPSLPVLIGRIASFIFTIVGLLIAATIVFPAFRPGDLIAGLGISSVAIGFAAKDILQNFFAGLLLLWKKPFRVGDEVELDGFKGTVESIDTRSTNIRTYSGERAVLPNGVVYASALLVKTAYETRRLERSVRLMYSSDLGRARGLALEALRRSKDVLEDPPPQVFVDELARSSIGLTLYFWIKTSGVNSNAVTDDALANVKAALQAEGIEFGDQNGLVLVTEDASH